MKLRALTPSKSQRTNAGLRKRGRGVRARSTCGFAGIEYINTPDGLGHPRACLPLMAKYASDASQTFLIRDLAVRITKDVPGKDTRGELAAIYKWVRDNIRYRKDPVKLELLQKPARTLEWRAGDCAAITMLISALVQALGHTVQYRTVGPSPNAQAHVQARAFDGQQWVDLDPVLESRAALAQARPNDLGKFGQQAPGAQHLWNDGGAMLGFVPNRQERMLWTSPLGFVPSQQERELWIFTPWEAQQKLGGANSCYVSLPRGTIQVQPDSMGRVKYFHPTLGAWGFLKKIGKAAVSVGKGAVKVASSGIKLVKKAASSTAGKVLFPVAAIANTKSPIQQAVVKNLPGGNALMQAQNKVLKVANAIEKAGSAKPVVKSITKAAASGGSFPGLKQLVSSVSSAINKAAGGKSLATQLRSLTSGSWKYTRAAAGLSGFRPSFSFSLGADPATLAQLAQHAMDAVAAYTKRVGKPPTGKLADVRAFQEAEGTLKADSFYGPNVRAAAAYYLGKTAAAMPKVAPAYEHIAVTWQAPVKAQPAPKPVKKPATVVTAKKPPAPAPKPAQPVIVAKKPATAAAPWNQSPALVAAANAAVAQVRDFIKKNGKPPQVKLAKVKAYQTAFDKAARANTPKQNAAAVNAALKTFLLTEDSLWGPDTQEMAANTLNVPIASLPPFALAYAKKTSTSSAAKPVLVKAATKPAATKTAAKPVLVKPATKPATKVVKVAKPAAKKTTTTKVVKAVDAKGKPTTTTTTTTTQSDLDAAAQDAARSTPELVDPWQQQDTEEQARKDKNLLIVAGLYWYWRRRHSRAA